MIASSQPERALLTHFRGFGFADPGCEQITTQLDCTDDQTGYSDEPSGHIRIVGRDYATAAETFTLSRSATDISNDGGSSKC